MTSDTDVVTMSDIKQAAVKMGLSQWQRQWESSETGRSLFRHKPHGQGAQWLSGRVLDSRPRGRGFEPHRRHCVVVLEQDTFILAKYWFNPRRAVPV